MTSREHGSHSNGTTTKMRRISDLNGNKYFFRNLILITVINNYVFNHYTCYSPEVNYSDHNSIVSRTGTDQNFCHVSTFIFR